MPRRPAVSVAICLFNQAGFIEETLTSVFAQTFDDFEVVIVDDGSTDGGADRILRRFSDPRLRIVRRPHRGLTIARRTSIAESIGEFVAFVDSDDLWAAEKLERQMRAARLRTDTALFCTDCTFIDATGKSIGRLSDEYRLADLDLTDPYTELLRRGCFVWQSTVMVKRSALLEVDAFNPAFPYVADYDTWLRIAQRHPLHYIDVELAKWRVHPDQFTRQTWITLADQRKLLEPLFRNASIPKSVRVSIGDNLLGQYRVASRRLLEEGNVVDAARAAIGMFRYPDRLRAFVLGAIAETKTAGPILLRGYKSVRSWWRRWRTPAEDEPRRGQANDGAGNHIAWPVHADVDPRDCDDARQDPPQRR